MVEPGTSKHRRWPIYLLVCLLAALGVVIAARGAGRWLVREDALAPADVIVVLSGSMPYRAEEGARLFKMNEAPEVWLTRAQAPVADLQKFGIHYIGEEEYSRQVLVYFGVPESAIHILPDQVVNTEQEVDEIARQMRTTGKKRAIVVSSPQHTRRVRALWERLAGQNLQAEVRAAFEDPYDANHWWRNTRDTFAVIREMLGLVNVWTGLPVRPDTT